MTVYARSLASSDHQGGDADGYRLAALAHSDTGPFAGNHHTGYTLLELEGVVYYMKYGTETNAESTNYKQCTIFTDAANGSRSLLSSCSSC
jgi:hypothetical protein